MLGVVLAAAAISVAATYPTSSQTFESDLQYLILVDHETGAVLFQKNADAAMPPASMAKLMTMLLVFEGLDEGSLALDQEFVISEDAWRRGGAASGGSTMFAELGSSIALRDLMRGVIVQSGNDAAIAIAEGIAGSEEAFADLMNDAAVRLGMTGSLFGNATGLPHPDQHVTARDLALLTRHIIREFPEHYTIYGETEFTWNDIRQGNRNPLLRMDIGADGVKTGFTEESGFGLVASAVRDERRLIGVMNGAGSEAERSVDARRLLEWGFDAFTMFSLFGAGEIMAEADIFGGEANTVGLQLKAPVRVLLPDAEEEDIRVEIVYRGPIPAPVSRGEAIGVLRILDGDNELATAQLFASEDVAEGNLAQKALDALRDLVFGWQ